MRPLKNIIFLVEPNLIKPSLIKPRPKNPDFKPDAEKKGIFRGFQNTMGQPKHSARPLKEEKDEEILRSAFGYCKYLAKSFNFHG